jgi:ATP-dependent DNA helicase RecG
MPTKEEILQLLTTLDLVCADDLEGQTLDFKEWDRQGFKGAVSSIVETLVCLANGGGGTLVVGVQDRKIGRAQAILGVPDSVDVNELKKTVYDKTDPKLTPTIDELRVPEGTGRLLVIQVYGDMRPYTDTQGAAKIRVGKSCVALTGSKRAEIMTASGDSDVTAGEVEGTFSDLLSPLGIDSLRKMAAKVAPSDLLQKSDAELLQSLRLTSQRGKLRKAAILLAGKTEQIETHFPGYAWSFLRMISSTDYDISERGSDCLAVAIARVEGLIQPNNPMTVVEQGLLHLEFRRYPLVALREGLINAFAHADYREHGVIQVKLFESRMEIANPGGLIGGVSEANILRHAPVTRNPTLVNALISLNLANRNNLGVPRMYRAMLEDGKEPPVIRDEGNAVRLTLLGSDFSVPFRAFVESRMHDGFMLSLEHLLVLNFIVRHGEIDVSTAASICQQHEREARESLRQLVVEGTLDVRRNGRGSVWLLTPSTASVLQGRGDEKAVPLTKFAALERDATNVFQSAALEGRGVKSSELREKLDLNSEDAKYLLRKMREKNIIISNGKGPKAEWSLVGE